MTRNHFSYFSLRSLSLHSKLNKVEVIQWSCHHLRITFYFPFLKRFWPEGTFTTSQSKYPECLCVSEWCPDRKCCRKFDLVSKCMICRRCSWHINPNFMLTVKHMHLINRGLQENTIRLENLSGMVSKLQTVDWIPNHQAAGKAYKTHLIDLASCSVQSVSPSLNIFSGGEKWPSYIAQTSSEHHRESVQKPLFQRCRRLNFRSGVTANFLHHFEDNGTNFKGIGLRQKGFTEKRR